MLMINVVFVSYFCETLFVKFKTKDEKEALFQCNFVDFYNYAGSVITTNWHARNNWCQDFDAFKWQ